MKVFFISPISFAFLGLALLSFFDNWLLFLSHLGSKDDSTYIVQTLDFHLGHNTMVTKPCGALESPMATITKITRRRHENPPHGVATVKEWFNYVTAMRNEGKHLFCNLLLSHTVICNPAFLDTSAQKYLPNLVTDLIPVPSNFKSAYLTAWNSL